MIDQGMIARRMVDRGTVALVGQLEMEHRALGQERRWQRGL